MKSLLFIFTLNSHQWTQDMRMQFGRIYWNLQTTCSLWARNGIFYELIYFIIFTTLVIWEFFTIYFHNIHPFSHNPSKIIFPSLSTLICGVLFSYILRPISTSQDFFDVWLHPWRMVDLLGVTILENTESTLSIADKCQHFHTHGCNFVLNSLLHTGTWSW